VNGILRIAATALITAGIFTGCQPADEAPAPVPVATEPTVSVQDALTDSPSGRVIILGFDGVEPKLVESMMEVGELPNLKRLSEQGDFRPLGTTIPAHSPVAWTSFSTSLSPRDHGVHSFFGRNAERMSMREGPGFNKRPELDDDGAVSERAVRINYNKAPSFWSIADAQGYRCKVLNVPFMTPPDDLDFGLQLCGLGVRDIRNTNSFSFSLSDRYTEQEKYSGGMKIPLPIETGVATAHIPGHPRLSKEPGKFVSKFHSLIVHIEVDRTERTLTLEHPNKTITLAEGEWSEWLPTTFNVTDNWDVGTISRFFAAEAGEHVTLYMTCFQIDPYDPYTWFTHPQEYSAELADRYGLYKNIGWAFDTGALEADALPDDAFLADVHETMAWRERLALEEIDKGDFDVLVSAWTGTDRVGHMYWRDRDSNHPGYERSRFDQYGRAVEDTYIKMDGIIGNVMDRLEDDDLLMIVSDHGMGPFREGFNVMRWLVQNGYAVMKQEQQQGQPKKRQMPLAQLDWSKTRAYFIGINSIYINVQGRERDGIVPAREAVALAREIRGKLINLQHGENGQRIFTDIFLRESFADTDDLLAPDLFLGYAGHFQTFKGGGKGEEMRQRQNMLMPTQTKWSGDHAGSAPEDVPGILFSNRPVIVDNPDLRDIGATTLSYLGGLVPETFEGKALVQNDR
jgi:predicted AlkP superfamily phosphohydrolase/phosphomutase